MRYLFILFMLFLMARPVVVQALAFPTAEGFGANATGGRGGYICHVDRLTDANAGSSTAPGVGAQIDTGPHHAGDLRYCIQRTGARNIVFDISGEITVNNLLRWINKDDLSILGQTAPSDGIMIRGDMLQGASSNQIVRFLRIRPGEVCAGGEGLCNALEYVTDSGLGAPTVSDIIIDHGSFGWGYDEQVSFGGNITNGTIQWSIISEAFYGPVQQSSLGFFICCGGSSLITMSVHHNLITHLFDRNPRVEKGNLDFVNNVIYNPGTPGSAWWPNDGAIRANIVGNWIKQGPWSLNDEQIRLAGGGSFNSTSGFYIDGNIDTVLRPTLDGDESLIYSFIASSPFPAVVGTPYAYPSVGTTDAFAAKNAVSLNVGVTKPARDAIDAATVASIDLGTGNTARSAQTDPTDTRAGGYPTYPQQSRAAGYDTDWDGMPDAWEDLCDTTLGISSTVSNHTLVLSGIDAKVNGYTPFEVYTHELAGERELNTCGEQLTGDATPPTNVAITAPTNDSTVNGASVTYSATAEDAESGVDVVEFYQNDTLITTDTESPYSIQWDTTMLPDGDKTLHVIATSAGGPTQSADVHVEVDNVTAYSAVHVATPPTIDGTLTEFGGANAIQLTGTSNTTELRFMWDSTALYIGAITTDTQLTAAVTTHDTSGIWQDDAIEIMVDTDNDGVHDATDYKFIVNAQEATWDASGPSFTLSFEPTYSAQVALVTDLNDGADDTSWSLEMAIPWAQIGIGSPAADQIYGINVQIDDEDVASDPRTTYVWNGSINAVADAHDVILGPDSGSDTTDPTNVAITDPTNNQYVGGTYPIRATAQDDVGIQDVRFYRDTSNLLCTELTATQGAYTCNWDTTQETEGSYNLHVNARDTASPTPNETNSATITVTVDNTAPTTPQNLSLSTDYDDGEFTVFANWDDSTDASAAPTYSVERCQGVDCDTFAEVSTEPLSDFSDGLLTENTTYCYRVLAIDAALNPSATYSDVECAHTLSVVETLPPVTGLTDTANDTISYPPPATVQE